MAKAKRVRKQKKQAVSRKQTSRFPRKEIERLRKEMRRQRWAHIFLVLLHSGLVIFGAVQHI